MQIYIKKRYRSLVNEIIDHKIKLKLLRRYLDNKNYQSLIRLLSNYETNITLTKEYFKFKFPNLFLEEDSVLGQMDNFSVQNLKAESERLFREYADYLYDIN